MNINIFFAENIIGCLYFNYIKDEVIYMAKKGMRRPSPKDPHGTESNKKGNFPKNDVSPVPEIQGKAKSGKARSFRP